MCFPPLLASDLEGTSALASWTFSRSKKGRPKYDRLKHGDFLDRFGLLCGKEDSSQDLFLRACFASLPQGDALGVEFAVDSHQALIQSHDSINDHTELRADRVFRGLRDAVGLVIDDFYAVPVVSTEATAGVEKSWATQKMEKAQQVYKAEGLLGPEEKDVYDAAFAKVTGAELNSSDAVRALGLATLGSPWKERLSLSFLSLTLAQLGWTTGSLHLCLLGGWVHSLLNRRPMMSILSESFHLVASSGVNQDKPKVTKLPRKVALELVLFAVLSPLMVSDLSAELSSTVYATDASDAGGSYVCTHVWQDVARALWRTGRKRGGYVRMQTREEGMMRKLDFMDEHAEEEGSTC